MKTRPCWIKHFDGSWLFDSREKREEQKHWCPTCQTHFTSSVTDHRRTEEHKVITFQAGVYFRERIFNRFPAVFCSSARQQGYCLLLHHLQETLQELSGFRGALAVAGAPSESGKGSCVYQLKPPKRVTWTFTVIFSFFILLFASSRKMRVARPPASWLPWKPMVFLWKWRRKESKAWVKRSRITL